MQFLESLFSLASAYSFSLSALIVVVQFCSLSYFHKYAMRARKKYVENY